VLADIDPVRFTVDPARLDAAIGPRTRALLPVHLYGQAADMDPILDVARRYGLIVIEDACQAHGAEYKGRRCGSMGDIAAFSFYPGKNLGACGEGGAAVTNVAAYADTMRLLRSWGERRRYEHAVRGFNYRMDGIQGAVLGVKLKYLEGWTEARRRHAAAYARALERSDVGVPAARSDSRHVFHVYGVRVAERDTLRKSLDARGIQTGVHYPIPVHLQPAHAALGYRRGDFPVAEAVAGQILCLLQIDAGGLASRQPFRRAAIG